MIPFVDLKQQYARHHDAFEKAIKNVCSSSSFILGTEVERFEKRFAKYLGVKECVGVASGTDALWLSCRALGLKKGDEILIPANTFISSASGAFDLGMGIVPVDVEPETYLIDIKDAEKKVSDKTKAIMPVHLYGRSTDMDAIKAFAEKYKLFIIEDACQSHGAMWKGQRTGSFGAVGCFSFYPGKNLGCFGDGGMVATNDLKIAEKIRLLGNCGSLKKYVHDISGYNSRLDTIQAAVLNVKADFIDEWNDRRFRAACRYADALSCIKEVAPPVFDRGKSAENVFHLFVIQCERRSELMQYLNAEGVQCGIHYPTPLHLHKAYESLGFGKGICPVAEKLADRILSLPMFPEITDAQIDEATQIVKNFYK
jgi:dTDP-4-amino-4,6-dideoxygalactose transaminase